MCLERLELVAKCFPHSWHWNLSELALFNLDLPSWNWMDSEVKDLIWMSGRDRSEYTEPAGEDRGGELDNLEERTDEGR